MRFLLDTHVLIWAVHRSSRLSETARSLILDPTSELYFSSVSIWETAIKFNLGRPDFPFDPKILRDGLLSHEYNELPISSDHAIAMIGMPALHKDPFDRILIAQATVEGLTLLTIDASIAQYPGPIRLV